MAPLARYTSAFRGKLSDWSRRTRRGTKRRSLSASLERLESLLMPTAFIVTSLADSGLDTLRQAILDSNANPGSNTISFQIAGTGVQTIKLLSTLTITAPVVLDATTQPGYAGSPLIALDGTDQVDVGSALVVSAGNTTVKGLSINSFSGDAIDLQDNGGDTIMANILGVSSVDAAISTNSNNGLFINNVGQNTITANIISGNQEAGVVITGPAAVDNVVQGNLIGTDATGTVKSPNLYGVEILQGASKNTIGGLVASAANVISGNRAAGVTISDAETSNNVVEGNLIGTDVTGEAALRNGGGVVIASSATANTIGGASAGARNVISGNSGGGVDIFGSGSNGNLVLGNYIGTDELGSAALGNNFGVVVQTGAIGNVIGGDGPGAGNLISGNFAEIELVGFDSAATSHLKTIIRGNLIGTDKTGARVLPGGGDGINIDGCADNTIGGSEPGQGNLISTGINFGITLDGIGTDNNLIQGNLIGTDGIGTTILGNSIGVRLLENAVGNTIGGTASGAGNVISGSTADGVQLRGAGITVNVVQGNLIGTDRTGTRALPNAANGLRIFESASSNTIGGSATGAGNVISGNNGVGLQIDGAGTTNNVVQGNIIGADHSGTVALANLGRGILIFNSASNNTIGGAIPGAGNLISGNTVVGMTIHGVGTSGNLVQGNFIGTDPTGTIALANPAGLEMTGGASGNTVGGLDAGARNVISGNTHEGLTIYNPGSSNNVVQGNFIGTDVNGGTAVPNGGQGVAIYLGAASNTIGGTTPGARNVISGNTTVGLSISGAGTSANIVQGNFIGTDLTGETAVPNSDVGVVLYGQTTNNTIGGTTPGARNVISGNLSDGVVISNAGTSNNLVQGNFIGTNDSGNVSLPNSGRGIDVFAGASGNTIGGTAPGAGNLLSGNMDAGLEFSNGASHNVAVGNLMGTDPTGANPIHNGWGVVIAAAAAGNTITGNVISGNQFDGVRIQDVNTSSNVVTGNRIGVPGLSAGAGAHFVPNTQRGVLIFQGATNNTIGGAANGSGNIIAQNGEAGVDLEGAGTSDNVILGNTIGDGTAQQPFGVEIRDGAANNTIGGPSAGNVITDKLDSALEITGSTSNGNRLLNNTIVGAGDSSSAKPTISITDASHTVIDGNHISNADADGIFLLRSSSNQITGNTITGSGRAGVYVDGQSDRNLIGGNLGSAASNVIELNHAGGIVLNGDGVTGTTIQGNFIGIDPAFYLNHPGGPAHTGNTGDGIVLGGSHNTVGGLPEMGNVISENTGAGVKIVGQGVGLAVLSNQIFGNLGAAEISRPTPLVISAPSFTQALTTSVDTNVQGNVPHAPGVIGPFIVQFFATDPASGFQSFIGQQIVAVGSDGTASFNMNLAKLAPGQTLVATSTDNANNTSAFSAPQTVQASVADVIVTAVNPVVSTIVGQAITYNITITNQGPNLAKGITFVDDIPAGATFVSATISTPTAPSTSSFAAGRLVATIGELLASTSATVTIIIVPTNIGVSSNVAAAASTSQDSNPSDNIAVTALIVLPPPVTTTSFRVVNQVVKRRKQAVIDVEFNGALDATTAGQKAFYSVWTAGRDKKFGTKDDVAVAIGSIQVAPSHTAVGITPKSALPRNKTLLVRINAQGVHDSVGRGTLSSNVSKAQHKAVNLSVGASPRGVRFVR
jgi:uncharacterized repeat protein (TIGR01451 family)